MSVESLLAESRALIERSRAALANMQNEEPTDRKRKKMNTEAQNIVTTDAIVDPADVIREERSIVGGSFTVKEDSEPSGELTAAAAGRMYATGMSVDAIAKASGVSYPKARRLIRESGVELRDPSERLKGRTRKSSGS